jgi:hypothetical protein
MGPELAEAVTTAAVCRSDIATGLEFLKREIAGLIVLLRDSLKAINYFAVIAFGEEVLRCLIETHDSDT